jgi:hypothetical protein
MKGIRGSEAVNRLDAPQQAQQFVGVGKIDRFRNPGGYEAAYPEFQGGGRTPAKVDFDKIKDSSRCAARILKSRHLLYFATPGVASSNFN